MSWDPHFGRAHCETVMSVYKPIVLFSIFYDINPSEHYKWNWDPEKNSFYYIGYPINPSENWIFKNQKKTSLGRTNVARPPVLHGPGGDDLPITLWWRSSVVLKLLLNHESRFFDFLAQEVFFLFHLKRCIYIFFPSKLPWMFPTSMDFPQKKPWFRWEFRQVGDEILEINGTKVVPWRSICLPSKFAAVYHGIKHHHLSWYFDHLWPMFFLGFWRVKRP